MNEIVIILRDGKFVFYLYGYWHEYDGYIEASVALKSELDFIFSDDS